MKTRHLAAEELAWLGVVPAALIMLAALLWLAPPLSDLYPDPDYPFYTTMWLAHFVNPEPLEATRFLLAIAIPPLLAAAVLALGSEGPPRRSLQVPVLCVQLGGVAFVAWTILRQRDNLSGEFLASFEPLLLRPRTLMAAPLIGLALAAAALAWDRPRLSGARAAAASLERRGPVALALAVALTALWLLPAVFTDANLAAGGLLPSTHVSLQFDELMAGANGRTPLVDYVPAYSVLLPIALGPVFPLFDSSITSFTVIMCLLSMLGLIAVYGALREITRRAWVALALYLPLMAAALQPWVTDGAVREFNGSYFATMPERYLGPFVVIWLCARHLRRGSPPVWAVFFAAGLAVFVNWEFGVPCLAALAVALALGVEPGAPRRLVLGARALEAAAGLLGALALVTAAILLRSGELPDFALLTYFARVVARGYSLTPMPEWGFHWVLYLTYAAALLAAAVRCVNRAPDSTLTAMLAFAGVFGLATGGYFAGRSLPWQLWGLFPAWSFALALLGWTGWLALRSIDRSSLQRVAVPAIAALTGFGAMVAAIDRFPAPWQQVERISAPGTAIYDRSEQQSFIESRTDRGEHVLILGRDLEHRIAERAGVVNTSPWYGTLALASPIETGRALDELEEEGGSRAFLGIAHPGLSTADEEFSRAIEGLLHERGYRRVATDPLSGTSEWRLGGS
jgi:hypothetical protein